MITKERIGYISETEVVSAWFAAKLIPDYVDTVTVEDSAVVFVKGGETIATFKPTATSPLAVKINATNTLLTKHGTSPNTTTALYGFSCKSAVAVRYIHAESGNNPFAGGFAFTKDNTGETVIVTSQTHNTVQSMELATAYAVRRDENIGATTPNPYTFTARRSSATVMRPFQIYTHDGSIVYTPDAFLCETYQHPDACKISANGTDYLSFGVWAFRDAETQTGGGASAEEIEAIRADMRKMETSLRETIADFSTNQALLRAELNDLKENGGAGTPGEPGKDGADGYTPQKGVDYWTEEDKAEIEEQTQAQIDEATEGISEQVNQNKTDISFLSEARYPFRNKKIVAIGDSIVQGVGDGAGGFLTALKTKYPSIMAVNMGVGSTTFAVNNNVPANASEGCIFNRIDDIPSDADYIILQGGLNDFFHKDTYSVPFGDYVDNLHKYPIDAYYDGSYHQLYYGAEYGKPLTQIFHPDTFCGAFEMSLVKIMTRFHDKNFVLLIPHDSTGSAELAKYLDAEARICKKYGFPCIDLRLSSGMPRIKAIAGGGDNTSAYTVDEAHPNMAGYTKHYLPAIEKWLIDGSVENAGTITLAEILASTANSSKVDISVTGTDGKIRTYTVYGTLTSISGGDEPTDPNKVPTSIDTNGVTFNGTGYQDGKRLSTSTGELKDATNTTATGFIQAVGGDTVYIGGLNWFDTTNGHNVIAAYKSDFTFIGSLSAQGGGATSVKTIHTSIQGGDITSVTLARELDIAYIRVSYAASTSISGADAVVTINEEIE